MTNTVTQLADKLTTKYDSSMFLGRLCWYAIPESTRPDHKTFCDLLAASNLGDVTLPPEIRSVDIFKRACRQAEVTRYKEEGTTNVLNYLVRNSGSDPEHVYRTLVRETFDREGHRLSYDEVAQIKYERSSEKLSVRWVVNPTDYEISLIREVKGYYANNAGIMTPLALREFIRKTLERELAAICVRPSGGVYFVGETAADRLSGLESVINAIGATFHTLPLMDDAKQREMLRHAFEEESVGDIDKLMSEFSEIMRDGKKITQDRYIDYKTTADALRTKIKDYSDLLDTALSESATRLEILSKQLVKLLKNNVKLDESA